MTQHLGKADFQRMENVGISITILGSTDDTWIELWGKIKKIAL
jgi:hypothetical protein